MAAAHAQSVIHRGRRRESDGSRSFPALVARDRSRVVDLSALSLSLTRIYNSREDEASVKYRELQENRMPRTLGKWALVLGLLGLLQLPDLVLTKNENCEWIYNTRYIYNGCTFE